MCFLYRGTWPQKAKARPDSRDKFGGTTWDDQWVGVPAQQALGTDTGIPAPYALKSAVFGLVWPVIERAAADDLAKEGGDC